MKRIKLRDRKLPDYTKGEEVMNMVTHIVGGGIGVLALLLKALVNMYKKAPKGIIPYCIMIGSLVLSAVFQVNILYVIIACALTGLMSSKIMARRASK